MEDNNITLLGLGPGNPNLLTVEAWEILESSNEIWLRTLKHPVVEHLPQHLRLNSFDYLYEQIDSFKEVYAQIVKEVLVMGRRPEGVVYAVPGHPFVAEATCPEIARLAKVEGLSVRVVDGLSFLEPTFTAIEMDPLPYTVLVDALELVELHVPLFPTHTPAIIAQIYSREIASEVKLNLTSVYPDEHPVKLVHAAGTPKEMVESLALYEIDRSPHVDLLTTLYLPPLDWASSFEAFQEVIAHLRSPEGCDWDRQQTHQTLRSDLLSEAYEVLAAIDSDDPAAMREELGDLLLLILLHAQIATEYGEFTMADVMRGIHTKIVNRHPHVFGDVSVGSTDEVLLNWERIKADERERNGNAGAGLLDGVNMALPALLQAFQYQNRAAHVGFDWRNIQGVWDKFYEEVDEVRTATDDENRADEIGDLLFATVNLARWYKIDPESELRKANDRFRKRFAKIEAAARAQGVHLTDLSLDEMESIWQASKNE